MLSILFLFICIPKRNATVMRRIENEHGCTLSRAAAIRTSGRSQAPALLALQISVEVAGLNFRIRIPRMNAVTTPPMIRIRFMLGCYICLYLKLERSVFIVYEIDETIYGTDTGGSVRRRIEDNCNRACLASFNDFICFRHCVMPWH